MHDVNSKPKIFTRAAFEMMELKSDDWFIDAEIMIQARSFGLRVDGIATVFKKIDVRESFVKLDTICELIRNLVKARIKEFFVRKPK